MIDAKCGESSFSQTRYCVRPVSRKRWHGAWAVGLYAAMAWGQAPVEKASQTPDAVLDAQQKVGMAYSEWQNALAVRGRAQTNANEATLSLHNAQQELNVSEQRAKMAEHLFETAKSQETAAHAVYDKAMNAVNHAWGKPVQGPR
jgi:hypothetical protein